MTRRSPLLFLALLAPLSARAGEPVRFNRDIRPILSDTCFHCHGFDPKTREAGLRLDLREEALKETENGLLPIVPGDPERSEIILRIFDEDDPMPPEKAHKPFTPEQKELFRRWVAEGAVYEPHWAYAPLTRPPLPSGREKEHPVDAFIREKLAPKGLDLSPPAAPPTLWRRLSLDLTGLPPQGEGAADYTTEVERLLASPHFGERLAVWWLDIARFADTVGFHGDQNQRIFPWRDYVIQAFNSNKPFDTFTREQLAGDLLPDAGTEQLVATGYNRLNMMTREGGAQPREYLAKYGAERVRAVAAAWFGSTFGCAECHDHKFDPIKARDFYELQAFFADVKQWGVYSDYGYTPEPELKGFNNDYPFPPEIEVESPWRKKRHLEATAALEKHLAENIARLTAAPEDDSARSVWEAKVAAFLVTHPEGWTSPAPVSAVRLKEGKADPNRPPILSEDGAVWAKPALGKGETLEVTLARGEGPDPASVRLELALAGIDPETLRAGLGKSVSIALEVRSSKGKKRKVGLLAGAATDHRPAFQSGAEIPGLGTEWRIPYEAKPDSELAAVWPLAGPIKLGEGETLVAVLSGDNPLPVRISLSPLASTEALAATAPEVLAALARPAVQRDPRQARLAAEAHLLSAWPDRGAAETAHQLASKRRANYGGRAWSLVTEAAESPLTVRVLPRGNWQDESGPVVLPATPSFLPGRIESSEARRLNRLDLANWIVSEANPITARAVMNRLWAMFFGTGLSAVVDDLGSQGELPSHPELLDWLAVEFRESGWDLKHMIRLLVTSETYRQGSSLRPEALALDPGNRLLASQNPRRLEAEFVRDNALAIAGLLRADEIGGPSVKPYQPEGYYAALQFPNREYVADVDERQWRRGLYTHWQRTFLHPMLANFDAPARDECAAARILSNTPQQALTLLNDPSFVEAARVLAARLLASPAPSGDLGRIGLAYRIVLNRDPREAESSSLAEFLTKQQNHYRESPEEAARLLAVGLAPAADFAPAELAAWTQLARVLLNTHESITRY